MLEAGEVDAGFQMILPSLPRPPQLPLEVAFPEDRSPVEALQSILEADLTGQCQYEQFEANRTPCWSALKAEKLSRPRRIDVGPYYQSPEADPGQSRIVPRPDFRGNRLEERAVQQVGKSVLDSAG